MAASAAYWIASACDELVVTPSGSVGSIGVLAVHTDRSAANEEEGIKPTYVAYGKYKAEFNPDNPLSDEALAELQSQVDEAGETFVKAVAKQRGCSQTKVREEFGQGRMCRAPRRSSAAWPTAWTPSTPRSPAWQGPPVAGKESAGRRRHGSGWRWNGIAEVVLRMPGG